MKYYTLTFKWWDELPLHNMIIPDPKISEICFRDNKIESRIEGWEFHPEYHTCHICKEHGHESDMMRDYCNWWVHKYCQERINENCK